MIEYTDECVGCPPERGCLGSACPNKNVKHMYCDRCDCECEKLYKYGGEELCEECLLGEFETIDYED